MATCRVCIERTDVEYAEVEAESPEEAEDYADNHFSDCEWHYVDGSMNTEIIRSETEEV